jgi:hypothetical protein
MTVKETSTRELADRPSATGERADLLAMLATHRHFLRFTTRELTDEQAGRRTTASELCLGGTAMTEADWARRAEEFRLLPGETLAGVLADYAEAARDTDELVATLPDLDAAQPLPRAPWYEPGARWSARKVVIHILAETAQHAGHADIIRESLDGAKSMG